MILEILEMTMFCTNCYILGDEESKESIVVDPGGEVDRILMTLAKHGLKLISIVNTHAHIDHIGGAAALKESTGAKFFLHPKEKIYLKTTALQGIFTGAGMKKAPKADGYIDEGDEINFGKVRLKVLFTPGHSPGGLSLLCDDGFVLVGDTLFAGSIGRTDLPGGSYKALINSVREKLFTLKDETTVYPGHGPRTTIGFEKKHNPFFQ